MSIVNYEEVKDSFIDVQIMRNSCRQLDSNLILPMTDELDDRILANDHTCEPIKNLDDIYRISNYLIKNNRYRDNMLFIVGINFGLRVSDLRMLRFCDIIDSNLAFRDKFAVFEQKTRDTKKVKKNRYITINSAVVEAVTLYLNKVPNVKLSDYMFRSQSNRGKDENRPITRGNVDVILKGIAKDLDLDIKMATHTLRKTFGYHQMVGSQDAQRTLLLLSKIFNHSSPAITMNYIGLTQDEIADSYRNLNLGSVNRGNLIDSKVVETA